MKTIVKYHKLLMIDDLPPVATYEDARGYSSATGVIKRIKYDELWNIVEIVDVDGTVYRQSSGKKRGRPKKEQPTT